MRLCSRFGLICGLVLSTHVQSQGVPTNAITRSLCDFSAYPQQEIQHLNERFILMSHFFKDGTEQFYFISDPNQPQYLLDKILIKKIVYAVQATPKISIMTFEIDTDLKFAQQHIDRQFSIQLKPHLRDGQYTASAIEFGLYKTFGLLQKSQRLFFYCGVKKI